MGSLIRYEACPQCGSKDNLAIYTDGKFCFTPGCSNREGAKHPESFERTEWRKHYRHMTLAHRNLHKMTCEVYDVKSKGRITGFPYVWKGKRYAIKYRDFNYPKENRQNHMHIEGRAPCTFFGWQTVHSKKVIVIVSGEFDAMAVRQMTNLPCVSAPNGDASIVATVKFHLEDLLKFEQIYLVPDNDSGCHAAFREAAELLDKDQVRYVTLSRKDANDYLVAKEYEVFKKTLYAGERLSDSLLIDSIKECKTHVEIIPTDIPFYNGAIMSMRTGEVTLLLGHTGQGKSSVSRWLAIKMAQAGYRTGIFSLEEQPQSYGESLFELFEACQADVDEYVTLAALHGDVALNDLSSAAKAMAKLHSCKLIIIDNLTAAADPSDTNGSLNELMKEVNSLAAKLNVHIICVSHTSREAEKANALRRAKGEMVLPPQQADAFGSSFLEKFAWNLIAIHVPVLGMTEFYVHKTRKGMLSLPVKTTMKFEKGFYYDA